MEFEVDGGQITKIYHGLCCLMHQVLKRYRNVFFACEQVNTMLYKFLNLSHIKRHITGVALSNFSGSYEGFTSH